MTHMDKLRVFGKAMRVMLSKHQTVQLPKEGQPDAGLTRYVIYEEPARGARLQNVGY